LTAFLRHRAELFAGKKEAPTVVEASLNAPETPVTHMGDENGCGVRRTAIRLQLDIANGDAQHKSAKSFG
jgi:hypothetical protein